MTPPSDENGYYQRQCRKPLPKLHTYETTNGPAVSQITGRHEREHNAHIGSFPPECAVLLRHGFESKSRLLKTVHPSRKNIFVFRKRILMAPHQTIEMWHEICALATRRQDAEQLETLTREISPPVRAFGLVWKRIGHAPRFLLSGCECSALDLRHAGRAVPFGYLVKSRCFTRPKNSPSTAVHKSAFPIRRDKSLLKARFPRSVVAIDSSRAGNTFSETGCRSQFCYSPLGCGVCDVLFGSSGGLM